MTNSIKSCPVIYYIARLQIYRSHVSLIIIIINEVFHPKRISTVWNIVLKLLNIFMKGFMEFKFLSIRHCCYNEQTFSSFYTMFNIWKWSIISSMCVYNWALNLTYMLRDINRLKL